MSKSVSYEPRKQGMPWAGSASELLNAFLAIAGLYIAVATYQMAAGSEADAKRVIGMLDEMQRTIVAGNETRDELLAIIAEHARLANEIAEKGQKATAEDRARVKKLHDMIVSKLKVVSTAPVTPPWKATVFPN